MFKKIGAGCCRSTSQSENIDQTNPVQTPSLRCNNVAPPLGLFHREMLQTVIALVAGCIEDIICIHHHAFHLRCSDASVSILFHSWTKYYLPLIDDKFLIQEFDITKFVEATTIWISNFFLWKNWLQNCRVAKLLFFLSHWWPKYHRWSWKGYLMFRFLSVVFLKWGLTNRWTPLRDRWGKYSILSSYLWSKL